MTPTDPLTSEESSSMMQFYVRRDNDREFSTSGTSIIFIHKGPPSNVYGVIDLENNLFFGRLQVRGRDPQQCERKTHISQQMILDALYSHVSEIIQAIATDPMEYFSTTGRQCGICMICGRELTDESSKRRGCGPVCAQFLSYHLHITK
jgi:hypothetical protein